ncbi:hypothetical protein GLV98_13135 [Halobacillus litoralis]|uniref:Uncharacterized protein n=1 Tax=Halobacillus litoralis TaxID=45668 RepID=A0A845E454_9BACI|nr:hypothetical protein [Halobacillus litoralis]MYL50435.1 hypothetical protein [Halobacillus litoralis]
MKILKIIATYISVLIESILLFILNFVVGFFDIILSSSLFVVPILFFVFKGTFGLEYWQLIAFLAVWILLRLLRHTVQKWFGDKLDTYSENVIRYAKAKDEYDG